MNLADPAATTGLCLQTWNEADRLAALERYAILDTGREEVFDDVAVLAADILDAPIAVVNFIAADRQWFKAEVGIGTDTLPLDVSICRHAILQPGVLVVPDLTQDPRFENNPLVDAADGLRFYAGALLETPEGLPLGTVCVLDRKTRPEGISERQKRALKVLASQTMARLELKRSEAIARAERARAEMHSRRLSLVAEASTLLLAADDQAAAVRDLFLLIADEFQLDVGFHYRCGEDALRLVAAAGLTPEQEQAAARIEFGQTVCGIVAARRESMHVTGIQTSDDPNVVFLKMLGLDSYFSAPLLAGGDLLGTVSFGRKGEPFSVGELEALRTLAAQLATTVERGHAEAAVRESEMRYRQIVEGAEDFAIVALDNHGAIVAWNSGAERILGFSSEEAVGQSGAIFFTPEDREAGAVDREMSRAASDGRAVNERWHLRKDGSRFWGSGLMMRLDQDGGGYLKIFRDRTAEHEAEAALRASEVQQTFLLSLSDALRLLRTPAEIASAAAESLGERFGLSRVFYAEYLGNLMRVERDFTDGVDSIVGEHDLAAFGPNMLRAYHECAVVKVDDVDTDERLSQEARAGLRTRQVAAYLDVVLFEDEQWVSLLAFQSATPRKWTATEEAIFREVGERVRSAIERAHAEERLREFNERLEAQVAERTAERDRLWRNSQDLLVVAEADGTLVAVNKAWTTALGWEELELVGSTFMQLTHPDDLAATLAAFEGIFAQPLVDPYEYRLRHKNGEYRWVSWTAAFKGGRVFANGRDVTTEKKREAELEVAQEALRQSQKMEAMGSLTGGVAHDFNNLLTPIVGSLDMLQRKGVGNEREQRLIAGAAQSAERAKVLVQRLLAFARRQPLRATAVEIGKLVENMADLIASTTGPQVKVAVEVADDLPPALADPNQVEMALLNLAVNARDAMPEGGTLRISAAAETVRSNHRAGLQPGEYVRLSVADTGVGMDEATLRRAVEPFFSTKGVGKGTGLGLSMAHGLASQLGGALTIQSSRGVGTNIELWLHRSVAGPEAPEAAPRDSLRPATRGTALLVDDEELVRMSTADMLADLGYTVVEAASAEAAMALVDQGLEPDLLLTDHLMPGMTGTDLARTLQGRWARLPVLVVSGYAESEGIAPDLPRLTKPFRNDELSSSLAALVEAGQA